MLSGSQLALSQTSTGTAATTRTDPFRLLRRNTGGTTGTHSQTEKSPRSLNYRGIRPAASASGIPRTAAVRQQLEYQRRFGQVDETASSMPLRPRFSSQANLAASADQRAERARQAVPNSGWLGQRSGQHFGSSLTRPPATSGQPLPSRPDAANERQALVQAANGRAFRQLNQRLEPSGAPNFPQLRSRVTNTGVDPRSMNARLGNSLGSVGGAPQAARFGTGRIQRR